MSTAPNTTTAPDTTTITDLIRRRHPDWKDDERVIVKFNDGSWYTNYGRIYIEPLSPAPASSLGARATILDDNTISYIQTICRAGATEYGCDAIRQRVACTIIRTYYTNIKRKDIERTIAGEVEAEKVMSDAYIRLTSYSASNNPGVNRHVWLAVEQLKDGLESVRAIIKALNDDLAKLN